MIKLAICDDQVLFLRGLKYIISDFDNIGIILEATNGADLLKQIPELQPDVILLDMKMPGLDGIEITKKIKADFPNIKIILLTMYDDERLISHVIEIGANGYLLKNEEPEVLQKAIESVYEKDFYFNDYVAKALIKSIKSKEKKPPTFAHNPAQLNLTAREREILQLICQEMTTAEMAQQLYISARTVEGHRKNLMEKTGVRNTAGLVIFAVRNKLVEV